MAENIYNRDFFDEYLEGNIPPNQKSEFEEKLKTDPELKKEFDLDALLDSITIQ